MACNDFIIQLLDKLSLVNPRLRCPITRLQIQIEMQYPSVLFIIEYFLMLKPEYQYNWSHCINPQNYKAIIIAELPAFEDLKTYITEQKLLTYDEAGWLDDAIHETLLDYDN